MERQYDSYHDIGMTHQAESTEEGERHLNSEIFQCPLFMATPKNESNSNDKNASPQCFERQGLRDVGTSRLIATVLNSLAPTDSAVFSEDSRT